MDIEIIMELNLEFELSDLNLELTNAAASSFKEASFFANEVCCKDICCS